MKLLHLFAGPFPTVQGTQVLVDQTCALLAHAGHDVHLVCYAHHVGEKRCLPYTVHRIPNRPKFAIEHSSPDLRKLALDLSLARRTAKLIKELAPDLVHAHHYEALVAARLADPSGKLPLVFHAHALFGPELHTYFPPYLTGLTTWLGRTIDSRLPHLADGIAAVEVSILEQLQNIGFPKENIALVRPPALPPSIQVPDTFCVAIPPNSQVNGQVSDNFSSKKETVKGVYVGNLDRYQGLDTLLNALALLDESTTDNFTIDIVTASDAGNFHTKLAQRNLHHLVRVVPHGSPGDAWKQMRAADFVLIPRSSQGGVPIKLINALCAGVATVVDKNIGAELLHGKEAFAVDMKDPTQVAEAIAEITKNANLRKILSHGALAAVDRLYHPRKSLRSMERLYEKTLSS